MNYRNPIYTENGSIDCEIEHPDYGWIPFTASPDDCEAHGRELFAHIKANDKVEAYVPPPPPPPPTTEQLDAEARAKRKQLLETIVDPVVSNPLRWNDLTADQQQAYKDYRQALLDITDQDGYPETIEWPTL
jgi:hypothetical protein